MIMNSVQLAVKFNVSTQDLWNAWTIPSFVTKWFGSDPGGTVLQAELDVKPGGKYTITFKDSNGTEHTCMGTYSKVHKFEALSFSWEWKSEPGHVSQVNIQFLPNNANNTTMNFEHKDLNPQSLHGYKEGWKGTFEKLTRCLLAVDR